MLINRFNHGRLCAPVVPDVPSGGGNPDTPPPVVTEPAVASEITKLMEQFMGPLAKSISDLRKEFQDADTRTNQKMKSVIDDLMVVVEGSNTHPSGGSPAAPSVPASAQTPQPSTPSGQPVAEEASRLAIMVSQRKQKEAEESARVKDQEIAKLLSENRRTKIEATVGQAMAKKAWAEDSVIDLVSAQMIAQADIDADGKVKIGGADPNVYIANYWEKNRWAQPPAANAGSGNVGGQPRRKDGSIDLNKYDPSKIDPKSDEFANLLAQTRRDLGLAP